jgi:hypothetical protein
MDLVERIVQLLPRGKVVVEIWCAGPLSDKEACELMQAQAKALRDIAGGLEAYSQPMPPSGGGTA